MSAADERRLKRVRRTTGWTASEALKRGLQALESDLAERPPKSAYEIYLELGIETVNPTRDRAAKSRELVRDAVRRKHVRNPPARR